MNKVLLTGRVVKKPELKQTNSNVSVCDFTIATNRPVVRDTEKKADFVNCVAFNSQAENLCKYQDKGSLIAVIGEIRVDNWENENGEKRSKTYVVANNIEFLESKKEKNNLDEEVKEEISKASEERNNAFEDFGRQIEIDASSLPF